MLVLQMETKNGQMLHCWYNVKPIQSTSKGAWGNKVKHLLCEITAAGVIAMETATLYRFFILAFNFSFSTHI